jgi:cytochrome c oxidase subunit 3
MALVETDLQELPTKTEDEGGMSLPVTGTVLFIASEVMFFSTLFATYFTLRAANSPWPPESSPEIELVGLPLILTATLLLSSVSMHGAVWGVRNDNRTVFVSSLAITVVLGVIFLTGEVYDALSLGFGFSTNVHGSIFFTILSFHGLHVLGGVVFLTFCLFGAMNGRFNSGNYQVIESAAYYWHFVDVVWIFVLMTLYILR